MRAKTLPPQRATLVRIIWTAMDNLWRARNEMEHSATEEDRAQNKISRMNKKISAAYKQKQKVSLAARTQLFTIPRTWRIQYRPEANERWLVLVASAVSNRQRQKDRLHKSLSTIANYYEPTTNEKKYKKSTQAKPYESPTYKQNKITKYYKILDPTLIDPTRQNTIPEEFPPPKILHRKFQKLSSANRTQNTEGGSAKSFTAIGSITRIICREDR